LQLCIGCLHQPAEPVLGQLIFPDTTEHSTPVVYIIFTGLEVYVAPTTEVVFVLVPKLVVLVELGSLCPCNVYLTVLVPVSE